MNRTRVGYTLQELLVVLCVVASFFALLVPTVRRVGLEASKSHMRPTEREAIERASTQMQAEKMQSPGRVPGRPSTAMPPRFQNAEPVNTELPLDF